MWIGQDSFCREWGEEGKWPARPRVLQTIPHYGARIVPHRMVMSQANGSGGHVLEEAWPWGKTFSKAELVSLRAGLQQPGRGGHHIAQYNGQCLTGTGACDASILYWCQFKT